MIQRLVELGWTYTKIAAHYNTNERSIRRWVAEGTVPDLPPPIGLTYGTALVVNDVQYPFYDPALWEVICQIAADAQPDTLVWNGDILDFPQLGAYDHNAYRLNPAKEDVDGFHRRLRGPLLDLIRPAHEHFNEGNHEDRLRRYAERNAPAVDIPPFREFVELPEQVTTSAYGNGVGYMLTDKLLVAHGWRHRKDSAYTARAHADDVGSSVSVMAGHTHRCGVWFKATPFGTQASYECGHHCDEASIPKAVQGHQNWQQTAGTLVYYERGGSAFDVKMIPVFGPNSDRVIANDREYRIQR